MKKLVISFLTVTIAFVLFPFLILQGLLLLGVEVEMFKGMFITLILLLLGMTLEGLSKGK